MPARIYYLFRMFAGGDDADAAGQRYEGDNTGLTRKSKETALPNKMAKRPGPSEPPASA